MEIEQPRVSGSSEDRDMSAKILARDQTKVPLRHLQPHVTGTPPPTLMLHVTICSALLRSILWAKGSCGFAVAHVVAQGLIGGDVPS